MSFWDIEIGGIMFKRFNLNMPYYNYQLIKAMKEYLGYESMTALINELIEIGYLEKQKTIRGK